MDLRIPEKVEHKLSIGDFVLYDRTSGRICNMSWDKPDEPRRIAEIVRGVAPLEVVQIVSLSEEDPFNWYRLVKESEMHKETKQEQEKWCIVQINKDGEAFHFGVRGSEEEAIQALTDPDSEYSLYTFDPLGEYYLFKMERKLRVCLQVK